MLLFFFLLQGQQLSQSDTRLAPSLEEENGIQICWAKRHFDLLVGNVRRQHAQTYTHSHSLLLTHTHAHPRIPIYPGICVLCAACGQPDKKAFSIKALLLFASRSRTTVAHVLSPHTQYHVLTALINTTGPKWKVAPPTNYNEASP